MKRLRTSVLAPALGPALAVMLMGGLLASCGGSGEEQLAAELATADTRLKELSKSLEGGSIRNATILQEYTGVLSERRPELAPLLKELKKDATVAGPVYQNLQSRLRAVQDNTESFESWTDKVAELQSIQQAAEPAVYNDSLSDSINVIADMSGGTLARVNAVSREAEMQANSSKDYGAGSQHIGNPHYGSWSHSSGGSFWVWYGQYHFFSSMFGGRRHYYNDWSSNRSYSYYHDVGRNSYTSPRQRRAQGAVQSNAQKKFGNNKSFTSPYAKSRSGASGISKASTAQRKSAFKSPYASSRTSTSKYASSARNSSSRTSRGFSRGK